LSLITLLPEGDTEPCGLCGGRVENFGGEAARARFLIVRMADRPFLGGGKCPRCVRCVCLSCAATTVYGAGQRRLHCPRCGSFLVGLRRAADDDGRWGAYLVGPPELGGMDAPPVGGGVPTDDDES
jgi:hypothetical protein